MATNSELLSYVNDSFEELVDKILALESDKAILEQAAEEFTLEMTSLTQQLALLGEGV